jgi:hypothetical protein
VSMPHTCRCGICGAELMPFFPAPTEETGEPRYCMCADPENCTQAVPGLICKAGHTVMEPSK